MELWMESTKPAAVSFSFFVSMFLRRIKPFDWWHEREKKDAEYCILRSEAAVRIPTDVDAAKYAPMLCAGVTVFNGMRQMQVPPGSVVAIQGLGGLGHLALQYANKFGYRVVALSRDSTKEKFARELGAHEYIDMSKEDVGQALQKLGGAAMIVTTAPNPDAVKPLLSGLGRKGKLLILSGALQYTKLFLVSVKLLQDSNWLIF